MADNCDYTMRGLRERLPQGFSKITASCCAGIIKDVRKQEDAYWIEDEELDELFDADKQEEELAGHLRKLRVLPWAIRRYPSRVKMLTFIPNDHIYIKTFPNDNESSFIIV